jgi:hypothetical protein
MPTKFLSMWLLLGRPGNPLLAWAPAGPRSYPQRTVRLIVPAGSLTEPGSHSDQLSAAYAASDIRNIANLNL